MFGNVRTVALPFGLLVSALLWGGCGHFAFSSLEDLCASHTVPKPKSTVVAYPGVGGSWLPTDKEIWAMERELQRYFIKPSMELGNANYSMKPPSLPSGFSIGDYFVSYDYYEENGQRFIEAKGFLKTDEHAKAWFENEVRENTSYGQYSDGDKVIPLRPFGGGSSVFDALFNVDSQKLVEFTYGAPL
ncbi:MAG: hypothetical protein SynsKO_04470 [Synoicihabitans sp.]